MARSPLQLAGSGARTLILERGESLPREAQNWDPEAVFGQRRYHTDETWYADNEAFKPGMFYYVGGNTKFYGAAMFRFRERDFGEVEHDEGVSPAWPISYADLEPWYEQAETLFGVHGRGGADPTDPPRSKDFDHAPVPHEPVMQAVERRMQAKGLKPFPMPCAIDFGRGGRCQRCENCDAFPCQIDAKGDAEIKLIRPATAHSNVELKTGAQVLKLIADDSGRRIVAADVLIDGKVERITADVFVLSAGAINSAALLLRSADARNPRGLANSSDQVGRNYMTHNTSALMAVHPFKTNTTHFPKTIAVHDYYFGDGEGDTPMGSLQPLGKIREPMLREALAFVPKPIRTALAPAQRRLVRAERGSATSGQPRHHPPGWRDQPALAPYQPQGAFPLGRQVQGNPARHRLSVRLRAPVRDQGRLAPVRHRALRCRPCHFGARPAVQGVGPRQPVRRRFRVFPVIGRRQPGADRRCTSAAGRGAPARNAFPVNTGTTRIIKRQGEGQ